MVLNIYYRLMSSKKRQRKHVKSDMVKITQRNQIVLKSM